MADSPSHRPPDPLVLDGLLAQALRLAHDLGMTRADAEDYVRDRIVALHTAPTDEEVDGLLTEAIASGRRRSWGSFLTELKEAAADPDPWLDGDPGTLRDLQLVLINATCVPSWNRVTWSQQRAQLQRLTDDAVAALPAPVCRRCGGCGRQAGFGGTDRCGLCTPEGTGDA